MAEDYKTCQQISFCNHKLSHPDSDNIRHACKNVLSNLPELHSFISKSKPLLKVSEDKKRHYFVSYSRPSTLRLTWTLKRHAALEKN